VAGEVALEQSCGFAAALAVGDATGDVGLRGRVVLAAVEHDRVERTVELAITAAAESVSVRLSAGGGDRCDAGEAGEGGFGADASSMRPGDDQLRADDRPDTGLVEQLWCEPADVGEDLPLQVGGFERGRFDSAGEAAQHEPCRELIGACRACASKAAAALEKPSGGEPAEIFAEPIRSGHDHTAQLHERFTAYIDGTTTRQQQQPKRLTPLPCSRERERLGGECRAGRSRGVERIILTAQPPFVAWAAADLEHCLAAAAQRTSS